MMTTKEFIGAFIGYYRIDINNTTDKIRVDVLNNYLKENEGINKEDLFNRIIKEYHPTGINPYPLLAHIISMLKDESKENIKEEAQTIADRIITAICKYGHTMPRDARNYIGEIGWRLVNEHYGNWNELSMNLTTDEIEITRSHLRDSALALIGRINRGVDREAPALSYKKKENLSIGE